jgi:hypothetical protein
MPLNFSMTIRKSLILTLSVAALTFVACNKAAEVSETAMLPIPKDAALALIGQYTGSLVGQLTTSLEENGPAKSVGICAESAPEIGRELSQGEYSIRRVGSRVRNQKNNAPTDAERRAMETLTIDAPFFQGEVDGHPVFMKGVFIPGPLCLKCHGTAEEIPAEVKAVLAERYPEDQAVGHAIGDLRGAVIIERN